MTPGIRLSMVAYQVKSVPSPYQAVEKPYKPASAIVRADDQSLGAG
jgi:hypothetical protein